VVGARIALGSARLRRRERGRSLTRAIDETRAAGEVLTAKQAPHRPGTAPALGLRAGRVAAAIIEQTTIAKEFSMWFRSTFNSRKSPFAGTPARSTGRRATRRHP